MPLDDDYYETPDGMVTAEEQIRAAIKALFMTQAAQYGFEDRHAHVTPRHPDSDDEWYEIAFIDDPDTEGATADGVRKLERHFVVVFGGIVGWRLRELTIRYNMRIYFGFKDQYISGVRPFDEVVALMMKFGTVLSTNQDLGLDERLSHAFLQGQGEPRFIAADAEDRASVVLDLSLNVTLKVC